jgi:hypothetical protein
MISEENREIFTVLNMRKPAHFPTLIIQRQENAHQ